MRKRRVERNLAFPSEEFRMRVRTAAKERGFRTEQAFILAACENELKRDRSAEPTTPLEAVWSPASTKWPRNFNPSTP